MLQIVFTKKMQRDAQRMAKRGKDMKKLTAALDLLASRPRMPAHYRDHRLAGELYGFRECHIEPDWLLIYWIDKDRLILCASATGTHSDLF